QLLASRGPHASTIGHASQGSRQRCQALAGRAVEARPNALAASVWCGGIPVLGRTLHPIGRAVSSAGRLRCACRNAEGIATLDLRLTDAASLSAPSNSRARPLRRRRSRSEEHTSELQSRENLVCRLLLEKKKVVESIRK